MAARFAVTTGNWSGAIWAATAGGAAGSAAVPTVSDDATINKNVTVTVDDTTAVCLSLTLSVGTTGADVGGKVQPSQVSNSRLTVQQGVTCNGSTSGTAGSYSSTYNWDVSAAPTITAELLLNNSGGTTTATTSLILSGRFSLKGTSRKRWSVTTGALTAAVSTSVDVADVTGWRVGDLMCFISTQAYNATPRTDLVTVTSITPTSGTAATVAWTGAVTYDHATDCVVGNFTSNAVIKAATAANRSGVYFTGGVTQNGSSYCDDVLFSGLNPADGFRGSFGAFNSAGAGLVSCQNNAFYDWTGAAISLNQLTSPAATRSGNVFYSTRSGAIAIGGQSIGPAGTGDETEFVVFRAATGINAGANGCDYVGGYVSGCTTQADQTGSNPLYIDCHFFGNALLRSVPNTGSGVWTLRDTTIGTRYSGAINPTLVSFTGPMSARFENCPINLSGVTLTSNLNATGGTTLQFLNKNADPAVQEIYGNHSNTVPIIQRDTGTISRSTSSVLMTCNATTAIEHAFEVLAKAGETIRIIGYVRKSGTPAYGASTLPKITISGLGITPVVATMDAGTAADAWEMLTLDATNSGASDGLLTVTFTAHSATAGAKAWFAGIPVAPFVSRCRHYGYTFDETNPVRATNITVSANEATAAAYTGMTVTWGASSSSVAVTTSNTLQKLYDYTQAQGCLNVGSAMPLTGAGVAGSPALFAAGDITVSDGAVLNGSGSLSMGGFTILATEFSSGENYSYTGGTWGQLSNSPTFAGGTLDIGAAATYAFTTTGDIIISMTPTAPSTYAMSSVTATGEIDLRNTTAHAITVELSSESSALAITANNTGGTITISAPQVYQQVPITNITTTSRVQIYDESAIAPAGSRELYNAVPGATSYTWTDPAPAVATRDIRVRISDVVGAVAKEFIEASIGTCGVTEETKSVSYRASQTADTTYNTNAEDGSTVTDITFTDAATDLINVNLAGGSTTWQKIYAAFVYWISTEAGIQDDIAYVDAVDPANYLLTSMKIKNLNATPLTITGGYGRDATTGSIVDIIDTTGGNIYPLVDHVVSKVVTVGGVNVITGDIADIPAAPSAATVADAVWAKELP